MRGRVAVVLLWCAATAGATALVQGGIGTIRAATRRDTVVDVQAVAVDTTGTWSGPSASPAIGGAPGGSSATSTPTSSAPASSAPASSAPTSPGAPVSGPATVSATGPATTLPATAGTVPTTTTAAPTAGVVTRTATTRGGTATFRYRSDDVGVVAATPNAGYTVKVSQRGATAVRVEFERADARSRIDAWWDTEARIDARED